MLGTGVLGVRLDPLEARLLAGSLGLELGDEHGHVAAHGLREGDRAFVREEAEAGGVLDVRLIEEDDAAQALRTGVVEQALAPFGELGGRYPRRLHPRDDIGAAHCPRRLNVLRSARWPGLRWIGRRPPTEACSSVRTSWRRSPSVSPRWMPPAGGTSSCSGVRPGLARPRSSGSSADGLQPR